MFLLLTLDMFLLAELFVDRKESHIIHISWNFRLHRNHSILKVKQQNYKKVLAWMKVNIKHQNDANWRRPGAFIANYELG